jgi:hypothetical protein
MCVGVCVPAAVQEWRSPVTAALATFATVAVVSAARWLKLTAEQVCSVAVAVSLLPRLVTRCCTSLRRCWVRMRGASVADVWLRRWTVVTQRRIERKWSTVPSVSKEQLLAILSDLRAPTEETVVGLPCCRRVCAVDGWAMPCRAVVCGSDGTTQLVC